MVVGWSEVSSGLKIRVSVVCAVSTYGTNSTRENNGMGGGRETSSSSAARHDSVFVEKVDA